MKIKPKIKYVICVVFMMIFCVDYVYSMIKPHTGDGISENIQTAVIVTDNVIDIRF